MTDEAEFTKADLDRVIRETPVLKAALDKVLARYPVTPGDLVVSGVHFSTKMNALVDAVTETIWEETDKVLMEGHEPDCPCRHERLQFFIDQFSNMVTSRLQPKLDEVMKASQPDGHDALMTLVEKMMRGRRRDIRVQAFRL